MPSSNANCFFKPKARANHFALFFGLRTARPKWPTVPRMNGNFILDGIDPVDAPGRADLPPGGGSFQCTAYTLYFRHVRPCFPKQCDANPLSNLPQPAKAGREGTV